VAAATLRIPHPYTEHDARQFLDGLGCTGEELFAITLRDGGRLCGGIGLKIAREHQHAELGYWIGVPYWGQGFATEAAREVLRHGFEDLGLRRVFASHFRHNPASGRVLLKLGMRHEGCQREHIRKWDLMVDSEFYGILRQEWKNPE
jgi:[ribosomal protein S5]-alanine N-acetyltransferase